MQLTPLGARTGMLGATQKLVYANRIIDGEDILRYTQRAVCYDVVAYVKYLHGAKITPAQIATFNSEDWVRVFGFQGGVLWNGRDTIERGKAIGFYRIITRSFFHAAIAVGGINIRGVNSTLSPGWSQRRSITQLLQKNNDGTVLRNRDGSFRFDNADIYIFISNL